MHRIVLVEDHPAVRNAVTFALEREEDLSVSGTYESGEGLLKDREILPIDLLITDLSLPGMNGLELIDRLTDRRPDLPILVVSDRPSDSYQPKALEAGATAYLDKMEAAGHLISSIRSVLGAHTEATENPRRATSSATQVPQS